MSILVLGSSGLLGTYLVQYLESKSLKVLGSHRLKDGLLQRHYDVTVPGDLERFLSACHPQVIINLVAMTDVAACEKYPKNAEMLNSLSAKSVSSWIKRFSPGTYLIHISTDHVYGQGLGPHKETSVRALNVYAKTKLDAEKHVLNLERSICLRTSFIGKSVNNRRASFTDWIYKTVVVNERPVKLYGDVLFSPVSMKTLARGIEECLRNRPSGLINFGSRSGLSKDRAGRLFLDTFCYKRDLVETISYGDSRQAEECCRPMDMRMDVSKVEGLLGTRMPSFQDELECISNEYDHDDHHKWSRSR